MIEFNKVSTESNFIKNLLHSTYLPLIRTVRDNDFIIKDRLYIYKCNIIRCTNSGYIATKNANLDPNLYPKATLRKSDDEKVKIGQVYFNYKKGVPKEIIGKAGDTRSPSAEGWWEYNVASYVILGEYYFGEQNDKFCSNFLSNSEGYDFKTHERLGHYLRSLRDMYGLNLMPLYNCFDNTLLRGLHIKSDRIEKTIEDFQTKIYKVPIKFNTDYTICMENVGMTTFAPAFIRHGTLLKLNNTRFGNGVDVTNKYIKLNHEDVIHNKPGLRFKNPIVLRFDNIPQNKKVRYSQFVYTEIPAKYMSEYYRQSDSAYPSYIKRYNSNPETYRSIKYQEEEGGVVIPEGTPNLQPGYEFIIDNSASDSKLYPTPEDGYYILSEDTEVNEAKMYFEKDGDNYVEVTPQEGDNPSENEWYEYVNVLYPSDELQLPELSENMYESINPSIGTFEDTFDSFKACYEDETFFNKKIFDSNKTRYYYYSNAQNKFIQCTNATVYDENEVYYYKNIEIDTGWYEFNGNNEFVPTQDTYIQPDKKYYKKGMTEIITSYNYDITEENCCMYDYVEDDLYLLIQVPSVFDSNIVILEGDYTRTAKEKVYDKSKFELFNDRKLDYLFTKNLKLMEVGTKKIVPFSSTLIQFLLWHAICNLDTINGDMDRLLDDFGNSMSLPAYPLNNYWYSRYRELVYNYADTFPKKYISDNLGYVTTDIENIIKFGAVFFNERTMLENTDPNASYDLQEGEIE